jgi:hypothetical protein
LEEMSVEERAELELELETWRAKGHLEKIQWMYVPIPNVLWTPTQHLIEFIQPCWETLKEGVGNLFQRTLVRYGDVDNNFYSPHWRTRQICRGYVSTDCDLLSSNSDWLSYIGMKMSYTISVYLGAIFQSRMKNL